MTHLVTRNSLQALLDKGGEVQLHAIGRALVALFNRQTDDEQSANTTNRDNGRGFTGADAKSGSITAKYYLKHRTLLPWQVDRWMKPGKSGYARLTKYWAQLDEVAKNKVARNAS